MSDNSIRQLETFIRQRKKTSGGYGATPKLPTTVQDTYHALSIINTLQFRKDLDPAGDAVLHDYLERASRVERQGARITFQILAACRLASVAVNEEGALAFVNRRISINDDLEEIYYCCRIEREILGRSGEQFKKLPVVSGQWSFRAASELWMLLYLTAGKSDRSAELCTWLRQCQGFDGGFGFLPGTTSFVDNCYDCLRALSLLSAVPQDPAACSAFISACRTTSGGFARKNRAAAFLSSTWHAVAALALLQKIMPSRLSPIGL